jgi:hypothetical protein
MITTWTIAGETGKSWNATALPLAERLIANARLTFRSLAVDELELQIEAQDIGAYTQPELGQKITLFRNGNRFFSGVVTNNPVTFSPQSQSLRIVVSGPWWWMERINYTSSVADQAGTTATRMTGVFGDAASGTNLKTAIETAIDRMVALGVPIANIAGGSSVTTFFTVPRVTLNQSTCAQTLSELVRLVPDTMVYFDYTTETPTLQVTRRAVADAINLTVGTSEIASIDIRPVFEMQVTRVELPFVERNVLGKTQFNAQSSGTAAPGRTQIITISGPELDTFLPNDLFDVSYVRSAADFEQFVLLSDRSFDNARGSGLGAELTISTTATSYLTYSSASDTRNQTGGITTTIEAAKFAQENGEPLSATGYNFLIADNVPQWAIDEYGLIPAIATGRWSYLYVTELTRYNADWSFSNRTIYPAPAWLFALNGTTLRTGFQSGPFAFSINTVQIIAGQYTAAGYLNTTTYHWTGTARAGTSANTIVLATTASSVNDFYVGAKITWRNQFTDTIIDYDGATRTATLSQSWSTAQRPASGNTYALQGHPLYRPADYSFIAPPANLAANLLAAQNFVPYEGNVGLVFETPGASRYQGRKLNIANSVTAHATMDAMISEESIDIRSGEITLTLGTPPRLDYRTFVDRIRKTPQDNIVFT